MPCANLHHVHFSFALPEVKGWKVTVEATRDKSFKPELVSAQRPTFCREDLNGQKAIDQHRVRPSWVQNMFVESIQSCWGSMSSCRFKSETLGQQEMRRQQWASTSWISKTNMTQNVVELMQMCASSKVKWVNSCQFYILAPHPLPCEAALPWSIECQPEGSVQEWWTGDRGLGIHIEHRSSWDSWECKMRCHQFFGACHAVGPKPHLAPLLNWTALERTSQEQLWKTEALVLRLFFWLTGLGTGSFQQQTPQLKRPTNTAMTCIPRPEKPLKHFWDAGRTLIMGGMCCANALDCHLWSKNPTRRCVWFAAFNSGPRNFFWSQQKAS